MVCALPELLIPLVLLFCPPEFQVEMSVYDFSDYVATSSSEQRVIEDALEAYEALPDPEPEEVATITNVFHSSRIVWDDLADCESGNWVDGGASFETGSARWDWGIDLSRLPPWGSTINRGNGVEAQFHGGVQFHPDTWNWVAPMVGLGHIAHAYDATREEQILVAEKTQELQGWGAWPVCSQKIGLR